MDYQEAAEARHTVRDYENKELPSDIVDSLNKRVSEWNAKFGLSVELRTNDETAFGMFRKRDGKAAKNFFILAGKDEEGTEEKLGYVSADLMLYSQTLGLNTWWIGLTYSRGKVKKLVPDSKVYGIVTVGYGAEQGNPHTQKKPEEVSSYEGDRPAWFDSGVKTALLAPTAMNRQGFKFEGKGDEVTYTYKKASYSDSDKGIVRFYFEVGAGKDNFHWADGWTA